MTPTPTAAARVSGIATEIRQQLEVAGWHDAAEYVDSEWMHARILAAIQLDPEPQPVMLSASEFMDFTRPLTDHPYDEQFDNQSDVEANPCGAWAAIQHMAHHLYATPSSAGTVSVEAVMREVHRFAAERKWHPSHVTDLVALIGALRALAGDNP